MFAGNSTTRMNKHLLPSFNYFSILFLSLLFACTSTETEQTTPITTTETKDTTTLSFQLEQFGDTLHQKTGLVVLEEGGTSLITRAWLCEHAQKTIDIQYFIFSPDNVGLIACDFLVKAADRGVKVRILLDDIMVDADINDLIALASHKNIEIKIYNPGVNLGKNIFGTIKKLATDFRDANQRMHNKTFIVDEKVAITGGRNIADEYFDFDHEFNFRDRDVLLLGKVVPSINQSFNTYWNNALAHNVTSLVDAETYDFKNPSHNFEKLHHYAADTTNFWPSVRAQINALSHSFESIKTSNDFYWVDSVSFVADEPGKNDGTAGLLGGGITTDKLIELINGAQKTIEIETPYLVTTNESRALLKKAIDRGVKIRIITNSLSSNDNLAAFGGYQKDRKKLLETGVEIYEFKPDAAFRYDIMMTTLQKKLKHQPIFGLHAKTLVIDNQTTVIGTFNFDPRSTNLNTECLTIITSEAIAKKVLRGIEIEFLPENSWKTTLSYNPDHEAGVSTRIKTWTHQLVPKNIL